MNIIDCQIFFLYHKKKERKILYCWTLIVEDRIVNLIQLNGISLSMIKLVV